MKEQVNLAVFYNEDNKKRATVSKDAYHYFVRCYHRDKLIHTELLEDKSFRYAEDLAENFVEEYGAFKNWKS
jgi:hypothetical protein